MASIQKYKTKSDIKWLFKHYAGINPKTGKKDIRTRRGFNSYEEAVIAAAQFEKDFDKNKEDYSTLLFRDVYIEWWWIQKKTVKPSTQQQYRSLFKNHVLPIMGNWRINAISKKDVQKFINDLMNTNMARSTVQNIKIKTAQVFEYAVKMDYIEKNTFEYVKVPKQEEDFYAVEEDHKRQFWYKHELNNILGTFEKEADFSVYALFRLLAYSGIRKGEALALKIRDIDFKNKGVKINKTLYFEDKNYYLMKPKTKKSVRFVPLDEDTLTMLKKQIAIQNDKHLEATTNNIPFDEQSFLFSRSDGRPHRLAMPNDELAKIYRKHQKNVLLLKIHTFRHTYASILFSEGKAPKKIQTLLGHKTIQTTMDVYTHISEYYNDDMEKVNEKMFAFI